MQTITVIIATYNSAQYLDRALASIYAQTYPANWEVIVVDDGSTDDTRPKITSQYPQIQYIYQPNQGQASAHNQGLRAATGEWITFLDADDCWPPDRTQVLMSLFDQDPALLVTWGLEQFEFEDENESHRWGFTHPNHQRLDVHLGARLFRKQAFVQVGFFDETMRCSDDIDWLYRAKEATIPMQAIEHCTLFYTVHSHGISYHKNVKSLQVLQSLKKSLDRRREANNQALPQISDYVK